MKHSIGDVEILTRAQVEAACWFAFLQGALAGTGITLLTLYAPRLWDAWTAWAAVDWLR